jgi:small redox-active disulfide protein 2
MREATMKIQILGGGCSKCQKLAENAQAAIDEIGLDAQVEKITDSDRIMDMGVMITPALAVDGQVKSTGRVLGKGEILGLIGS